MRKVTLQFLVTNRLQVPSGRGQLMRLPAWHAPELILALHVLKKRHHALYLSSDGGLASAGVVILDQAAQTFVDDVPDPHEVR